MPWNFNLNDLMNKSVGADITNESINPLLGINKFNPLANPNNQSRKDMQTFSEKGTISKNIPMSEEERNGILSMRRNTPEAQGVQHDVNTQEQTLNMLRGMPSQNEAGWLKPLIALSDSMTGSKLMQGYQDPTANSNKIAMITKYKDDIEKRKNDYMKMLTEGIPATTGQTLRQGTTSEVKTAEDKLKAGKTGSGLTPGELTAEKAFGTNHAKWLSAGGFGTVDNSILSLDNAIAYLKANPDATGINAGIQSKFGTLKMSNPTLAKHLQDVNAVSLLDLKQQLPGAISDYESKMKMNLDVDPMLDTKENIDKLEQKRDVIQRSRDSSAKIVDRFVNTGYIKGSGKDMTVPRSAPASLSSASPVGTIKVGNGGISYKKSKAGPDNDKNNWEKQ